MKNGISIMAINDWHILKEIFVREKKIPKT
jgi:hypothetical protein